MLKVKKIRPGYRSNHSLIELNLKFHDNTLKSKTFWKFNNLLLHNFEFIKEVKGAILKVKEQYTALPYNRKNIDQIENEFFETTINKQLFLEMILLEVRSVSISFSVALKKKRTRKGKGNRGYAAKAPK